MGIQWNPSKPPTLGTSEVSLLEEWPHFRGEFVLKSMLWDFLEWPEYRGGHISGVLVRGVPMYVCVRLSAREDGYPLQYRSEFGSIEEESKKMSDKEEMVISICILKPVDVFNIMWSE